MNQYKIHLKDFCLMVRCGITDEEKLKPQEVIINICLDCQCPEDFSLESVTDYDAIKNTIADIGRKKHYPLLEELAKIICDACLQFAFVKKVEVALAKPDIYGGNPVPMISWHDEK